ncbi:antibiotic biosynthesis monooxygenase family protein [Thalassospira lucentensis]|uniref:Antibiotic biosynthesis monooxygenase n=1 Tax=Thalassospira lucentensis TaxID=168935 RepID=A0A358HQ73_9PROT|nr:antibiotic biosynthesis monooxygenase [Thalassospira lucentensis]HBU97300.1 antibiotic biosynthesis monooxygenase [Thalassospira lucentensis]HCW67073.1 antibiotic biosynthesis monooxygenase [Thalassospira lucentensis]|tara:strand:+ start:213 stop:572 length:360 start_codon:yes stop_codon:yes gene_type:complete
MIAVIFEVTPHKAHYDEYLAIAADLKPILEGIDGFISIERFQSMTTPGKVLSLSFWRDEDAVKAWRNVAEHRAAQVEGRNRIFADYRLRVAAVIRDYGMTPRDQVPDDSSAHHDIGPQS